MTRPLTRSEQQRLITRLEIDIAYDRALAEWQKAVDAEVAAIAEQRRIAEKFRSTSKAAATRQRLHGELGGRIPPGRPGRPRKAAPSPTTTTETPTP